MTRSRKILLIFLVLLAVVVIGYFVYPTLLQIYIENNYEDLGSDEVAMRIEPARVYLGESITIIADFERAYDFSNNGWYRGLGIQNQAGAVALSDIFEEARRESLGCMTWFAPPSVPPQPYTDRLSLRILPEVPPGDYTIQVGQGTYCNGLPSTPVSLQLTVLPK